MATRRGAERQAESNAFEAANPFLTRVDTRIETVRDEDTPRRVFEAEVTQDGEEVESFTNGARPSPFGTSARNVETPVGILRGDDEDDGGVRLLLTGRGFGVDNREDRDRRDRELNDEESLIFRIRVPEGDGPGDRFDGPESDYFEMGGFEFGVDFLVRDGRGTVEIELIDYDRLMRDIREERDGPETVGEASSGIVSGRRTEGSVEADVDSEAFFDVAIVTVTGDLEVVITGIDIQTNFAGGFDVA